MQRRPHPTQDTAPKRRKLHPKRLNQRQKPQPDTEQPPESPEPQPTAEQQLGRDIKTGQFTKREKPETDYSRAQKEEARKDRHGRHFKPRKNSSANTQASGKNNSAWRSLKPSANSISHSKRKG